MKKWLICLGILSVAVTACFVAVTRGQFPASQGHGREIELIPPTNLVNATPYSSAVSSGLTTARPRGVPVKFRKSLMCVVQTQPATNGGSLTVYFQSSADNGQTWQDFASIYVTSTSPGTYYVPLSLGPDAPWPTTVPTNTDGTMTSNTINQWGIGDRIRAKYQAIWNTSRTGNWAFQAYVIPD